MFSPGYEVEMQTKPDITKKIEEDDTPLTTEQAAAILLQGNSPISFFVSSGLSL